MIQSNEARVGNVFIRELRNTRGLEYDHDFVLTEEYMGILFGLNPALSLQDLFPIPLTHDILIACGFKERDKKYFSLGDYTMAQHNWIWYLDYLHADIRGDRSIACPAYLHQLQNIIFALTGQELNYSPTIK